MQTRDTFAGLPVHTRAGRILAALAIFARAAGIDRSEPGCAPQISATCPAPVLGFSSLPRFTTAIAA